MPRPKSKIEAAAPAPPALPAPRRWADLAAVVGMAVVIALFLAPYVFLGRSMLPLELLTILQPWARHAGELWGGDAPTIHNPLLDSLQQYYPRRVYFAEALWGGWLPFWNSNVYGGSPFLATQQTAVLYPPAWLLALLPAERQFGWSAWLHMTLAAGGGYAFLRQFSLRRTAAVLGGLAFALNGFVVVWLAYPNVTQWTLCWLPLALALFERSYRRRGLRATAGCAAVLALVVLGGHGQTSAYVLLSWGLWAAYRALSGPRRLADFARYVVLPGGLALTLALPHLLPALEYLPRTDRGARVAWDSVVGAGMPLAQFWTLVLPRLFGDATASFAQTSWLPHGSKAGLAFIERTFYPGVTVLALAAGAFVLPRGAGERRGLALFCAVLTGLAVLLAMGTPLYWPLWRFAPGFGNFTAIARILCVAAWPLACLAALGAQSLLEPTTAGRARKLVLGTVVALVLVALTGHFIHGGAAPQGVAEVQARMGQPTPDALAIRDVGIVLVCLVAIAVVGWLGSAGKLRPLATGVLLAGVVTADLFAFGFSYNPASDPALAHAETPELQALKQRAGDARFLSLGPPGDEDALRSRMPSNLPSVYGLGDIQGSDSFFPRRYLEWREALRLSAGGRSPWGRPGAPDLRGVGVRYYLTGSRSLFPGLTSVVDTALQEDSGALPYARLHTHVRALEKAALLDALAQPDRAPQVALTVGPGAPEYAGAPRVTKWQAKRLSGNRLVLEGEAPEAGLLVVCEGFDPGWRAWVDGRPAEVTSADWLLLGVPVPEGRHTVRLEYTPPGFRAGLFLSLLALAAVGTLVVGCRPRGMV
jgi:hypothetical protein